MSCKSIAVIILCLSTLAPVFGLTAQDYLNSGRASLFDGTLTGIRQAYDTFGQGLNDPSCTDCAAHRELLFFHAVSRIAMWAVREDGDPVDSAMELSKAFGTTVEGEALRQLVITAPDWPENRYGQPVLSPGYVQYILAIAQFAETVGLPELEQTIAELEQIQETPGDLFRIFLTPNETSVFVDLDEPIYSYDIEVDYADVLMLKGMLYTAKGVITAQNAYDTQVDPYARVVTRIHENCFSIENDLLLPHPDLLKLLPTANDPTDGAAVLAQARQDILTALQYYYQLVDYLWNEDTPPGADPQDDELFSLDPNDRYVSDAIKEKLLLLNDSLINDTAFTFDGKTRQVFVLSDPDDQRVTVYLEWGPFGNIDNCEIGFQPGMTTVYYHTEASDIEFRDNRLYVSLEDGYGSVGAYFAGLLSDDHSIITDASLEYWGQVSGNLQYLSGAYSWQGNEDQWTADANPILGASPRYPNPISPRDYLCAFDEWNKPAPGSLPDTTIGGIMPNATDLDWIHWTDPQPAGSLNWPLLQTWQMYRPYGQDYLWPAFWLNDQLVFTDNINELDPDLPRGLDIQDFYLALHNDRLYGSFLLTNPVDRSRDGFKFSLILSHSPDNPQSAGSMRFDVMVNSFGITGQVYYRIYDNGYTQWRHTNNLEILNFPNQIDFSISLWDLPASISGRYLSIRSDYKDYYVSGEDKNDTHIQIGSTGTIAGNVIFPGHLGGPIFVQAYCDPDDPEGSLVAYTMLDGPGPFMLSGIGMGWQGYVRAISPMFGDYHPLDMDALKAEEVEAVALRVQHLSNVSLLLTTPPVLKTAWHDSYWAYGYIDTSTNLQDYFAFDAIAGVTYQLDLRSYSAGIAMTLLDRNGCDELIEFEPLATQSANWLCPVNGRYYIKVSEQYNSFGGEYEVRVLAFWECPPWDISGSQWEGVKDCQVDLNDFALVANQWLNDCSEPYWCQESDFNQSGAVELYDLQMLMSDWLHVGSGSAPEPIADSFETGDFSALPWHFGGSPPWRIVSDSVYEGNYSARSAPIGYYQYSEMSVTLNTGVHSSISFAWRISSREYADYLRFYVNGIEQASWCGQQGWGVFTCPLSEGQNTFKWRYSKNGWTPYYSDCAWIDDIRLNY